MDEEKNARQGVMADSSRILCNSDPHYFFSVSCPKRPYLKCLVGLAGIFKGKRDHRAIVADSSPRVLNYFRHHCLRYDFLPYKFIF